MSDKTKLQETENGSDRPKYLNLIFFSISHNYLFALFYLFISIIMNINNRMLFGTGFKFNFTLMLLQQITTLICFNFIFTQSEKFNREIGKSSFKEFLSIKWTFLIISFIFIANILTSFIGNQKVSTPMFLCLRKFLIVFNLLFDLFFREKKLPNYFIYSVILITLGAVLISLQDLTSELIGYFIVFLNNFLSMIYGQYSESFKKDYKMNNLKLLSYISYISIPILIVLIYTTGELDGLFKFDNYSFKMYSSLIVSCLLTILLNASYFISNDKNSSLFTQMCSNSKDIFITFSTFLILGDFSLSMNVILGIVVSTLGAFLFTVKSLMDNIKKVEEKVLEKEEKTK